MSSGSSRQYGIVDDVRATVKKLGLKRVCTEFMGETSKSNRNRVKGKGVEWEFKVVFISSKGHSQRSDE